MELRCTAERETHLLSILRRELQLSSTLVRRLKYCGAYTVNGELLYRNVLHAQRAGRIKAP